MQAEFELSAAPGDGVDVRLAFREASPGAVMAPPQGRAQVQGSQGLELSERGWKLTGSQAAIQYTVSLPVTGERPGANHGSALAALKDGVLVARQEAVLPALADGALTPLPSPCWPVRLADGLLLAGEGIASGEYRAGETALELCVLPGVDAGEAEALGRELAPWAKRWAAFRMSQRGAAVRLLVSPEGNWLGLTPSHWGEVSPQWGPVARGHALMHAGGLLARPASPAAWWAHEGIAEYCARVEVARTGAEADRELRTWLAAAYREHGELAVAPAELRGDRLPVVGALLAHALSTMLLAFSGGFRSIFHLVDDLNARFVGTRGYDNDDLAAALFSLTGRDFGGFVARHVVGREKLPGKGFGG